MKSLLSAVLVILMLFAFGCSGGGDKADQVEISKKELAASATNKVVIKGTLKNNGTSDIGRVSLRAEILDENDKALDTPFDLFGPVKGGEEIDFELKSNVNYYDAKSFNLNIESAQ